MAFISGGTDIGRTGRTITADLMLGGTVLAVFRSGGVIAVIIGTFAAVITGIQTVVAGAVVILPRTITVTAVIGTAVYKFIASVTVFIPFAAIPFCIGIVPVIVAIVHEFITVPAVFVPFAAVPFGIGGTVFDPVVQNFTAVLAASAHSSLRRL